MFAVLTNTQGNGQAKLAVHRLDDHWLRQEEIYSTKHPIQFPDRFAVLNFHLRVRTIRFPSAGMYEVVMYVDSDEVAHRRVRIYQAPPGTYL